MSHWQKIFVAIKPKPDKELNTSYICTAGNIYVFDLNVWSPEKQDL